MGNGTTDRLQPSPVDLPNPTRRVGCGAFHSLTVSATGESYTWGKGLGGQLGQGDGRDFDRPGKVDAPVWFVNVVGGWEHR